ncbi:transcriptional repressor [Persicimonas caeni]|uniref:Transcriptional repressor n=1 Tax=Persicimonas caeni TaxID=2292766 RepID=A0A4Y6PNN8_PERCE|nr:Fur family transcriptional regulator [Persicimonas caeni]QDG49904.1 transcriptional repressor [Persicimonas caeni]QED31125.1 transcriptional repressor [Persicimonas caeni]
MGDTDTTVATASSTAEQMSGGALDAGLSRLKSAGYRLTPQRKAILELFDGEPEHMTPQQIFGRLEDTVPSLSLATVYNTLELFEDVGIVARINAHDGQTYFDPTVEPHHHAVCDHCGEIFDVQLESDSLQQLITTSRTLHADDTEFVVETATVWLRGVCSPCRR